MRRAPLRVTMIGLILGLLSLGMGVPPMARAADPAIPVLVLGAQQGGARASDAQGGYDFGGLDVGTSATVTFNPTLLGSGSFAYFTSFTFGGANPRDFAFTNKTCPTSPPGMPSGSSCQFSVTFSPAARGPRSATLTLGCTASNCPLTLDFTGTGTGPCGKAFGDVKGSDPACEAIEGLAARGIIKGCDPGATPPLFCPTDRTLREQLAALIVRAIPAWAGETGQPTFTDNTADAELMTRVSTLQRHSVVRGYQDDVCRAQGKTPPCYGPLDNVTYGQALLFIARAFVASGAWALQPDDRTIFPEQNGTAGADPNADQQTLDHRAVVTYVHYLGAPPDVANVHATFAVTMTGNAQGWGDAASRAWFARALWPALQSK